MTIYTALLMTNLAIASPMPSLSAPAFEHLNSSLNPVQIEALQPEYRNSFDHRGSGR
ncbi:hypothetical protein [Trichothermofontia sp.]